jgi:4-amino-4-deoxy-L-arabinose transferase-like glycosyltransferase
MADRSKRRSGLKRGNRPDSAGRGAAAEGTGSPGGRSSANRPGRARRGSEGGALPAPVARLLTLGAVAAVILLFAFVRVRLADVPLERDEGEYAYAGQLILQGVPPYVQAYNMKFPGTYYAYALIMALFGQTPSGIHLGLLLVNAATTLLVFSIGRRLSGDLAGAIAAAAFGLLSIDRWVMGVFAHATHFVLLPALAGLYLLLPGRGPRRAWRLLLAGALLGVAVLMKQHAVFYLPLGALLLLARGDGPPPASEGRARRPAALSFSAASLRGAVPAVALLAAGALVPFALLCALFLWQGVLGAFWFWTFQYAKEYVSEVPLSGAPEALVLSLNQVLRASSPLWLLGGAGLIALFAARRSPPERLFVTGLLAASLLAVCPGWYFRMHYFILVLPAIALLVGIAFDALGGLLGRALPGIGARLAAAAAFAAVAALLLYLQRDFLFTMTPRELSRTRYGSNPFIEAVEVGREIAKRTAPGDRIAVLGSEPEIYFYANRRSATGYIYTYPLMESQKYAARMQDEMRREIEKAHPKFLVFAKITASWLPRPDSDKRIIDWGERYVTKCFDLVGIADIYSRETSAILWDEKARGYEPRSQALLYTFRRKSDAPCSAGG